MYISIRHSQLLRPTHNSQSLIEWQPKHFFKSSGFQRSFPSAVKPGSTLYHYKVYLLYKHQYPSFLIKFYVEYTLLASLQLTPISTRCSPLVFVVSILHSLYASLSLFDKALVFWKAWGQICWVICDVIFELHKLYHKDLGNLLSDTNLSGTPQLRLVQRLSI